MNSSFHKLSNKICAAQLIDTKQDGEGDAHDTEEEDDKDNDDEEVVSDDDKSEVETEGVDDGNDQDGTGVAKPDHKAPRESIRVHDGTLLKDFLRAINKPVSDYDFVDQVTNSILSYDPNNPSNDDTTQPGDLLLEEFLRVLYASHFQELQIICKTIAHFVARNVDMKDGLPVSADALAASSAVITNNHHRPGLRRQYGNLYYSTDPNNNTAVAQQYFLFYVCHDGRTGCVVS